MNSEDNNLTKQIK